MDFEARVPETWMDFGTWPPGTWIDLSIGAHGTWEDFGFWSLGGPGPGRILCLGLVLGKIIILEIGFAIWVWCLWDLDGFLDWGPLDLDGLWNWSSWNLDGF